LQQQKIPPDSFLADNHIRLNITPPAIISLKSRRFRDDPIAILYRSGFDVTINSDDVLIFDSECPRNICGCINAVVWTQRNWTIFGRMD
jgi:adenosine deaminase